MYEDDRARPTLRDSVIPEGTGILGTDRASRAMRDRYVAHLTVMHAQEAITQEEFDARRDAAMEAVTLDQLRILLRDLPALPSPPPPREPWKEKDFYVPVLICGILASIAVAVSPFFILALLGLQNSAMMMPLGVGSILFGIVGALACGVTLAVKLED